MFFEFKEKKDSKLELSYVPFFKGVLILLVAIPLRCHEFYTLRYVPKSRVHFD